MNPATDHLSLSQQREARKEDTSGGNSKGVVGRLVKHTEVKTWEDMETLEQEITVAVNQFHRLWPHIPLDYDGDPKGSEAGKYNCRILNAWFKAQHIGGTDIRNFEQAVMDVFSQLIIIPSAVGLDLEPATGEKLQRETTSA